MKFGYTIVYVSSVTSTLNFYKGLLVLKLVSYMNQNNMVS